jgi:conjugal transfer pilus assembly protein TraW
MMAIMAGMLMASSLHAETSTIGRTWPIAEPDALSEIEGRAHRFPT